MGRVDDFSFMTADHREQGFRLIPQDSTAMHWYSGWLVYAQQFVFPVQEIVLFQQRVLHSKQFLLFYEQKKPGYAGLNTVTVCPGSARFIARRALLLISAWYPLAA
jgi:hypothetical protein